MKKLSDQVRLALDTASIKDRLLTLTVGQMNKTDYAQVKKVLQLIEGVWVGGKKQGFRFPTHIDIKARIDRMLKNGEEPDPNPHSLFQTPPHITNFIIEEIVSSYLLDLDSLLFLEPNAGRGAIAQIVKEKFSNPQMTLVEIDPVNYEIMQDLGLEPICHDFLTWQNQTTYDLSIINPPFNGVECAHHFLKAWKMLNPKDGQLVAILPGEILKRANTQVVEEMLDIINRNGYYEDLPDKSFAPATDVATIYASVKTGGNERSADQHITMMIDTTDQVAYKQLCRIYKTTPDVDLFDSPIKNGAFWNAILDVAKKHMLRYPSSTFILTASEEQEIVTHYYDHYKEYAADK